jgi:hypothetical protein
MGSSSPSEVSGWFPWLDAASDSTSAPGALRTRAAQQSEARTTSTLTPGAASYRTATTSTAPSWRAEELPKDHRP